jgi:hypothetical protein
MEAGEGDSRDIYLALAMAVLTAHLMFNLCVVFGAVATRRRPKLAALHMGSVLYGTFMENAPWSCPLTLAENYFKAHAGLEPYGEPFVLHYLHAVVSPSIPMWVLRWGAISVGLVNVAVYTQRHGDAPIRPHSFGLGTFAGENVTRVWQSRTARPDMTQPDSHRPVWARLPGNR